MIDFVGALVVSFVLGLIIGIGIRRQELVMYVVLFLLVVVVSYFVGNYPFYTFTVSDVSLPINLVFITSYVGLVVGSLLLRGGRT